MITEPISEKELAGRLNLSRETLAALRAELLEQGPDFTFAKKNGALLLTPSGVEKLTKHLSAQAGETGAGEALEKAVSAVEGKPEVLTFHVVRSHPQVLNERIVLATEDPELKKGPVVTIRVRNNRLYAVRSVIYAIATSGPVYQAVGRVPRWKGQKLQKPTL